MLRESLRLGVLWGWQDRCVEMIIQLKFEVDLFFKVDLFFEVDVFTVLRWRKEWLLRGDELSVPWTVACVWKWQVKYYFKSPNLKYLTLVDGDTGGESREAGWEKVLCKKNLVDVIFGSDVFLRKRRRHKAQLSNFCQVTKNAADVTTVENWRNR